MQGLLWRDIVFQQDLRGGKGVNLLHEEDAGDSSKVHGMLVKKVETQGP